MTTRLLVGYVRAQAGEQGVGRMLELAAETRPAAELEDESTWSTRDQGVALMEAAAEVVGDPQMGRRIGAEVLRRGMAGPTGAVILSLGSPSGLMRGIAQLASKFSTFGAFEAVEVGAYHAVLSRSARPGLPAHPMFCDYTAGLLAQAPTAFGLPPGIAVEEECEAGGSPRCRFRVSWADAPDPPRRGSVDAERVDALISQLSALTERFSTLQDAATDLVSTDEVETILARIASRAATAVRAPHYLLAVQTHPNGALSIHHDGLAAEEAQRWAAEVLAPAPDDHRGSRLIVDVASAHRHYGRLAAIYGEDGGGFVPAETHLLAAYARHAAAALDVATALEESHRRGETARVLLELAGALADPGTPSQVAQRLAEAVPHVIGCDVSGVVLRDRDGETWVAKGVHGLLPPLEEAVRALVVRPSDTPEIGRMLSHPEPRTYDAGTSDGFLRGLLQSFRVANVLVVPIAARGDLLGVVIAGSSVGSPRLPDEACLTERLTGLADQAATALENARLLEEERQAAERLHRSEARVRHLAFHDALTGLPNRLLFDDRVNQALALAQRNSRQAAVLFLDLDRFKRVNDMLGHAAGNELLRQVAQRLSAVVRGSDTVARMGGDEFTLLLPEISHPDDATMVADKVVEVFGQPFAIDGREIGVTASVGVAVFPQDGQQPDALVRHADKAMYRAKKQGRNNRQLYGSGMTTTLDGHLSLEADLQAAIEREELTVLYQPQMDLQTGHVTGVEALVRWHHPRLGPIGPEEFIPLAEEIGVVNVVDCWVLHQACAQGQAWAQEGLRLRVAVNTSALTLGAPGWAQEVPAALAASSLAPELLELEVTEGVPAPDDGDARAVLQELRALGVRVAVDDFGTGYSMFGRLRDFPADRLKIDQSFVAGVGSTDEDARIVAALIAMAHSLRLEVVAEGVETAEQLAFLRRHGCDHIQGYFFSQPVGPHEVERLCRSTPLWATAPRRRSRTSA